LEAKASAGVSQKAAASTTDESDDDEEAESESQRAEMERVVASSTGEEDEGEAVQGVVAAEEAEEGAAQEQTEAREATAVRPSLLNYLIAIILLGFCPLISGYVFAAAYDFAMSLINANAIEPGIYPTLSLLGGLLPWRLAAPISLSGANGSFIVSALLWRIPDSFLGNPSTFDIQTLEALVFNATGLALLLLTMYGRERSSHKAQAAPWSLFCIFEFIFGFFLILPANLWLFQGLEGILQIEGQTVALPTVHFLNTTLFLLNLITGSLFCLLIGLIVRRQYTLWTQPRAGSVASADAQS
jgi:hypothetical protein